MSGFVLAVASVAVGRFAFTVRTICICKLIIMNDASRKNMMSISGMITIRAQRFGMGDVSYIKKVSMSDGLARRSGLRQMNGVRRFSTADHHLDICRRRFQIKLQLRHLGEKIVERDERKDRDAKAASRRDQRLADAAGDGSDGQFGATDVKERTHQSRHRAEQTEQRPERDERVHDRKKTSGAFEFDARRQL